MSKIRKPTKTNPSAAFHFLPYILSSPLLALVVLFSVFFIALWPHSHVPPPRPKPPSEWSPIADMLKGRLADDVPAKMTQGLEQKITVRIAANTSQDLTRGLGASNPAHTEDIQVAPYMTVKLIGDAEAFQITSFTPEEQFVATDTYTQWQFSVTPLQAGIKELDLLVGVRVKSAGLSEESRFYPTYERKVEVTVDRAYEVKQFLGKKWQWIVGAILVPIFLLWLGKKFKSDDKPEVGTESEQKDKKDADKPLGDNAKASEDDDGLE